MHCEYIDHIVTPISCFPTEIYVLIEMNEYIYGSIEMFYETLSMFGCKQKLICLKTSIYVLIYNGIF
jgi:hypothetical protein